VIDRRDPEGRNDDMAEKSLDTGKPASKTPQKSSKPAKPSVAKRLGRYFNDVRAEMRRVVWPTRTEVINSSWIVVITLLIFVVLIFAFDELSSVIIAFLANIGG